MELTNNEIRDLYNALLELNGTLTGFRPDGSPVYAPFALHDKAQYALIKNKRIVKPLYEDFAEARKKIVEAHLTDGKTSIEATDPAFKEVGNAIDDLGKQTVTFEPHVFQFVWLNAERNGIGNHTIEGLMPILTFPEGDDNG